MRVSTSKLTYVVLHMSLLQSCLGGTLFGARSSGPEVRGPKFGARLLWHRYAEKHLITSSEFTYMCFYMPLLQSCLGALCSGPAVRGPKFGARLLWHRYAKKHLITSSEFTYMCFCVHAFATKLPGGTLGTLFGA